MVFIADCSGAESPWLLVPGQPSACLIDQSKVK